MKKLLVVLAMVMIFCLALTAFTAFAEKSLEGDANVDQRNYPSVTPFIHPPFYNVKLIVEVDDNGIITSVKDNGTGTSGSVQEGNEEFWATKNKPYFDAAVNGGLLDKFVGKTLEEVKAMDMTSGGTDAVSGATMVSAAAQEAVINAMEGRKGKAFLPNEGNVLPLESVEGNVITLKNELPADFDLQVLDIRWSVYNDEIVPADSYTAELKDGKLVITFQDIAALKAGYYYVNVVDGSGTYRSPAFEGGPASAQAPYFIIDSGLKADDISFDGKAIVLKSGSMADYLKNIQHVQILADGAEKPVEQEIVGHHGTVGSFIALDENGVLNADGVVKARNGDESPLFEDGKQYTVTVSSFGYPELVFQFSKDKAASDSSSEIIEIDSAEKLAKINENLSGHYVLTADIDLAGIEWTPIGSFVMGGGEEGEMPDMTAAFTGTFDGQEHTIKNLTINQPEDWALGLFGCAANAEISNFTLENATVNGSVMVADVVGYAYFSTISNVKVVNGKVNVHYTEMSAEGMYGGIAGAGMASLITGCEVEADIVIPDNTANAGVLGGGLEMTSVVNCKATGSVTAGNNCYGIGGISGCGFASEQFTDNISEDVTITVGDNCFWIGGITGYAGGYPVEELGMPVTVFTNCNAVNVTVNAGENADGIGDIVGSGFYSPEVAAAQGAPFDQPTQYELVDCKADPAISVSTAQEAATGSDDETEAAALLENIKGTYEPLFPVITKLEYDQLWLDPCIAVVGEEAAPQIAEMLKAACNGTIYGQEAIDAFGDGSNGAQFDCLFINGVSTITFDGATISGTDESGNQVFSHEYTYVGKLSLAGMMEGYLYETADEDAGEFKYFYMMPDTPSTTFHLEFRYGSNVDDLARYNEGPYAYWLAAGFPVDADADTVKNVIELFCLENMEYSAHSEGSLAQLKDLGFEGKWVADMSPFGEAYADVELYMIIDENGHGLTFMNGQQTRDFEAFAFDNGEKGDGAGLYVAYDNEAKEPEAAPYTMVTDDSNQIVLTFYATDGVISYVKAE